MLKLEDTFLFLLCFRIQHNTSSKSLVIVQVRMNFEGLLFNLESAMASEVLRGAPPRSYGRAAKGINRILYNLSISAWDKSARKHSYTVLM